MRFHYLLHVKAIPLELITETTKETKGAGLQINCKEFQFLPEIKRC